jgi:hypothetical protein
MNTYPNAANNSAPSAPSHSEKSATAAVTVGATAAPAAVPPSASIPKFGESAATSTGGPEFSRVDVPPDYFDVSIVPTGAVLYPNQLPVLDQFSSVKVKRGKGSS